MLEIQTRSARETRTVATLLAREILRRSSHRATVIALEGNLGSGKTTFVQGFAQALGVCEKVASPTFVLMKIYPLKNRGWFKHFIHLDCYRVRNPKELIHLGFQKFLHDRDAILLIEWADRVRRFIPRDATWIWFQHGKKSRERIIEIASRALAMTTQ